MGVQHNRPHQHCLSSLVGLHAVGALVQHHPHSIHSVPGNRASTPSGSLRKAQRRSISLRARQTFAHTGDEGELLTKVIREGWLPQMHVEEGSLSLLRVVFQPVAWYLVELCWQFCMQHSLPFNTHHCKWDVSYVMIHAIRCCRWQGRSDLPGGRV